jgi:hypothetical protein
MSLLSVRNPYNVATARPAAPLPASLRGDHPDGLVGIGDVGVAGLGADREIGGKSLSVMLPMTLLVLTLSSDTLPG